jgi:hypothetical protein
MKRRNQRLTLNGFGKIYFRKPGTVAGLSVCGSGILNLQALETDDKFEYNMDYKTRDRLLNIGVYWEDGPEDIAEFEDLGVATFAKLLEQKFIDPSFYQNRSPSVKDFPLFMMGYPRTIATGYAVSPFREDYRISVTGIYVPAEYVTPQLGEDFQEFCGDADELSTDNDLYAWWD